MKLRELVGAHYREARRPRRLSTALRAAYAKLATCVFVFCSQVLRAANEVLLSAEWIGSMHTSAGEIETACQRLGDVSTSKAAKF